MRSSQPIQQSPVRVLHVLGTAGIGGVERLALDLIAVQRKDPTLDTGILFVQSADGGFAGRFRTAAVPLHSLDLRSGRELSLAALQKATDCIRQYDVVHMHVFNPTPALAAIRAGKPVVYTIHGVLGHGRTLRWPERVNDLMLRWFINRHARVVTFTSKTTEISARARYGLSSARTDLIYNGIAPLPKERTSSPLDPAIAAQLVGRFVVGTFSRFAAFKRIDRLVDAFTTFAQWRPEARLLLVGDGVTRPELEAQVRRLDISDQVIFAGYQPEVAAYTAAMSVCVFPSEQEPFGLVSLEAMALGKPVVVLADGGGLAEVVGPFCADDVVPDTAALARRLLHYADTAQDRSAALQAYATRFDIAHTAAGFRQHYVP